MQAKIIYAAVLRRIMESYNAFQAMSRGENLCIKLSSYYSNRAPQFGQKGMMDTIFNLVYKDNPIAAFPMASTRLVRRTVPPPIIGIGTIRLNPMSP